MEEIKVAPFVFWCTDIGNNFFPEKDPVPEEENYSREGWNT
jgi:hypothetical protein